jgi:Glycosyl hydrolases family 16
MRRKSSAAVVDRPESPAELIARISAENGASEEAGRHRRPSVVVSHGPASVATPTRALARRLAPLAVGAAVALVAATVAALVQPVDQPAQAGPELSSALVQDNPAPVDLSPAGPTEGGTPSSLPPTPVAAAPRATTAPKPVAKPVPATVRRPAGSGGDGTQAAAAKGWTLVGGEEFSGGMSSTWGVYEGAGNDGAGKRVASAISVSGGILTISGDSKGNTGGMAWNANQRFGKWEMRARFPKGDEQYHPVLILWPQGEWPQGGEVDFAETTSAADDVSFYLHYSSSNQQKSDTKKLDITQWHNYAVEWVDGRITGYIDGQQWFQSTDDATMPPGPMHATIQLDYFPDGGSPRPTQMQVDYMRIYK